jgi:site-specific recombinase
VADMTALTLSTAALATEAGHYIQAGVFSISVANLIVIVTMIVVFVLALVVPFPSSHEDDAGDGGRS